MRAPERDRVEIRLAGPSASSSRAEYAGYLVVDGRLRELPIGSSFDPERGAFYWQPGLGYVGDYDFVFIRTLADGTRERIPVRVTLDGAVRDAIRGDTRPLADHRVLSLRRPARPVDVAIRSR